ncbi:MAG: hypothetical protein P4M04_04055 [Acidobacteriota bacterium]|nr:hypothetical protein [Acidobacteriota bacterium]
MSQPCAWPAPWVFGLLILPLGMVVGFNVTPLPFLLAKAGVSVDPAFPDERCRRFFLHFGLSGEEAVICEPF